MPNQYGPDAGYETLNFGNAVTNQNPQGSPAGSSLYGPYTQQTGYADAYDPRIGAGPLPRGVTGSANRAYVGEPTSQELVENRMSALLANGSPYLDRARIMAESSAADSGFGNTSIAAGAGVGAAIDRALPIVESDAGAYRDARTQNVNVLNERAMADQADLTQRAGYSTQLSIAGMNNAGQLQRQREGLAYEGEQAQLERIHQHQRDYWGSQYRTQEYANQTGIDLAGQRSVFFSGMFQRALDEGWTPEELAAVTETWLGVYDGFEEQFNQRYGSPWGRY